jgi:hypothetical protein
MKNALLFFAKYITVLLVGAFVGIACVYLFFMITSLRAGGGAVFPTISVVYSFILLINICVTILACFCLITRIARQSDYSFVAMLVCIAFHVFTWFVFLPVSNKAVTSIIGQSQSNKTFQSAGVSPGYFRQIDGKLFYFFRINEDKTGDGVLIDLNAATETYLQLTPLSHAPLMPEFLDGDPLIYRTVAFPPVLALLLRLIVAFGENAETALRRGILTWYAFASVCFPLTALISFAHVSRWKLINFSVLVFGFCAILLLNLAYFAYDIPAKLPFFTGLFRAAPVLNRLSSETESYILLVVFNVLAAVIVAFLGFRAYIKKKRSLNAEAPIK